MDSPKTLRDLIKRGVPEVIVSGWIDLFNISNAVEKDDYDLTAFQSSVFSNPVTLDGNSNLIIAGPTTSGKTLIAQAIISKVLSEKPKKKVLYLVPLRALVTEKYHQFQSVFKHYRILPASTDYPRCDNQFEKGDWDITVAVFEKVFRWITKDGMLQRILQDVELVVIDELQVLEMSERGEKLEGLIAFFLWCRYCGLPFSQKPRLISLVASEEIAITTNAWLRAEIPGQLTKRPVPLYEGWISPKSKYEIYSDPSVNKLISGDEYPPKLKIVFDGINWNQATNIRRILLMLVKGFVSQQMRILVYVAGQGDAEQLALWLSEKLRDEYHLDGLDPDTLLSLEELEDSPIGELLKKTLLGMVGFHHGNMTQAERQIVERGFIKPGVNAPIYVVVTTPTLSMGVNLPADVVLMQDHHTFGTTNASDIIVVGDPRDNKRLLTVLDYRNFAGRAGRYKLDPEETHFGLCLFLINNRDFDQEISEVKQLLFGSIKPMASQLSKPLFGYHPHILAYYSALSQILDHSLVVDNIINILKETYLWISYPEIQQDILAEIELSLKELRDEKLLGKTGLTGPGKVAAAYHMSIISAKKLISLSARLPKIWPRFRLELLYELSSLPEVQTEYPRPNQWGKLTSDEVENLKKKLKLHLKHRIPESCYSQDSIFTKYLLANAAEWQNFTNQELSNIIRAILIWEWLNGRRITILNIEKAFPPGLTLKQVESLAERVSFYMGALRNLWEQTLLDDLALWDQKDIMTRKLWLFERMVLFGMPIEVVPLPLITLDIADIRLTRKLCMQLYAEFGGWNDVRDLIGMPYPSAIRNPRTWDEIQRSLIQWDKAYQEFSETENMGGSIMIQTIHELSQGLYGRDFLSRNNNGLDESKQVADWQRRARLDNQTYQNIIELTERHIARYSIDQLSGLRGSVESALARPPINCVFHPAADAPSFIRIIRIDQDDIIIALIPGKPSINDFKDVPSQYKSMIVICGESPDSELQNYFRKKVRLFIVAEALFAGSELVELFPEYLKRFSKILQSKGIINSIQSLFEIMFPPPS